jgi:uncharacterized membrane protein
MKIFTTILIFLAVGLTIFNLTLLDYEKPLEGKSAIALIGVVASLCAVLILIIFKLSKKIEEKLNN